MHLLRYCSKLLYVRSTLVFVFLNVRIAKPENLTMCLVTEDDSYYFSNIRAAAVIDLAMEQVNSFAVLPGDLKLQIINQTAGPSCTQLQYTVVSNVMELIRSGTNCLSFLGVSCPTSATALYGIAHSINVPILGIPAAGVTSLSTDDEVNTFPLLARVPFGFGDICQFLRIFMETYNYKHVSILRDDSNSFYTTLSTFTMRHFRSNNAEIFANTLEIPFFSKGATRSVYEQLLNRANDVSRVIVLLTNGTIVRQIMVAAQGMGLTTGQYVFIAVELYELSWWGKIRASVGDRYDTIATDAFNCLLIISLYQQTDNANEDNFETKVKHLAKTKYNYSFEPMERIDPVLTGFYEAIIVYAQEVALMIKAKLDYTNGSLIASRITDPRWDYLGIGGRIRIGDDGERDREFEMKSFNGDTGKFEVQFRSETDELDGNRTFRTVKDWHWRTWNGRLPPDEPVCGFSDEKCVDRSLPKGAVAAAVVVPILVLTGLVTAGVFAFLRLRRMRKDYDPNWWKINTDEVNVLQKRTGSSNTSKKTLTSHSTKGSSFNASGMMTDQIVASYKGATVSLIPVTDVAKPPGADVAACMTLIKTVAHPNLQRVIGVSIKDELCEYVIEEICSKGSVTNILQNEIIKLDWSFKNSLIKDLVTGMAHLHSTAIGSHGHLNSHVCLVDTRFTLKISDYGTPCFRKPAELQPFKKADVERDYEPLLWRAPELLRQIMPAAGTQKGDVYSFAIILQQIILRSGPFELPNEPLDLSEREILEEVVKANIPPTRPRVPRASCSNELYDLMEKCWEEIPLERPTFAKIKERLRRIVGDLGENIVDLLFRRMEQYAADLEVKVAEKTQQFMDEKNRSEQLLCQLLPKPVAAALTRGEHIDPEAYESVTIYFSDIVGFTTISSTASPMDVVNLLNNLYTFFDGIIEKHDVYKVETIGDAYMVASGLPVRNGNKHAAEIATMSLTILNGVGSLVIPHRPTEATQIRIGLNSGPCVAGIVGLKMPRYCLFGDTVNVASRMESTGEPMKIQLTAECKALLESIGGFRITERGEVFVKGKGTLVTYWLLGK
ncbi:atrial natriuretic peptide receptor 1-like isoform X2 [Paramacrobiotus metropolitanus]|uniref:atrial natriuretic peptide receptor 1-like isoform X2 n=1 Tax=Paramacrobiotus metropolitanus TaxID=2943436 RepID=UPI0024460602|nr:atrial natriuretic peptide receptor 1-like isoform X2 [Paramacrobiotus metropolitanus]